MILSFPKGRRVKEYSEAGFRRAIRNPKDFLKPGFPAINIILLFKKTRV
jgi:hypothetical protein